MYLLNSVLVLYWVQFRYVESIQVDLPVGSVLGKQEVTSEGKTFYSFLGIPYGESPIGNLRFQAPVEKAPWSGVLNVTEEAKHCYERRKDNSNASENCLVINVFTPTNPHSTARLPVMFWIYGGGFVDGYASTQWFSGHHFMDKDVILVTFNYRTGPLGFLSFSDHVLPGNAGLKDQLLALEWTNKYIKYFGGDPDRVTIFGQSAGAASVAYHMLNPKSSGLYGGAILQSGSALSPWAFQRRLPDVSYRLAERIDEAEYNKLKNSSSALLEYLQSLPVDAIQRATDQDFPDMTVPSYNEILDGFYFTPTIEPEHDGAFLTEKMFGLLESGNFNKVPILMGFTTLEWGFLNYDSNFPNIVDSFDGDIKLVVPKDMKAKPEDRHVAANQIYRFYNQDKSFKSYNRNLLEYFSDQGLTRSIRKYAELASRYTDVFFYQFSYKGKPGGAANSVIGFSDNVFHSEELYYLFSGVYNNVDAKDWKNFNELDRTTGQRMITMWTNFAKDRNPTPGKSDILQNITWPKFNSTFKYLDIGSSLEVKDHPKEDMYRMWEGAYEEWGVKPFDTY